jgi:hypothetical protein
LSARDVGGETFDQMWGEDRAQRHNFKGLAPMPWMKSAVNWYPRTEQVQPEEIRVIFMALRS